jgi:transposase-like protein
MFSAEYKREQVERLLRGELSISELSRELGVSRMYKHGYYPTPVLEPVRNSV